MRKAIAASVVVLLVACSSTSSQPDASASNVNITMPEILLVQSSGVPVAARHTDGPLSIQYALRVENRADQPIKLQRVTVQSIAEGAYFVPPTSRPFDVAIEPAQMEDVQFWVSARPGGTLVGANGPVTLRVTCQFDSPAGKFQHIVMRTVNDRTSISGSQ